MHCLNVDGMLHYAESNIEGGKLEADSIVHIYGRKIGFVLTYQQQDEKDSSELIAAGYE